MHAGQERQRLIVVGPNYALLRFLLSEELFDIRCNIAREEVGHVALVHLAHAVHQELFEVPLDFIANDRSRGQLERVSVRDPAVFSGVLDLRRLLTHPLEERVGIGSVDFELLRERELGHKSFARSDVFQGRHDFRVFGVLLKTKLVAGEAQNGEALLGVLILQPIKLRISKLGQTSQRSYVYAQHHLASDLRKLQNFASAP